MLLALSYDEYERWASLLRELRPTAPILTGQYPKFMEAKREGRPWSDILRSIASSYYHDGAPNDPMLWSEAAATYQLILTNRKQLRLDRTMWGRVAARHGTLCLRVASRVCAAGSSVGAPDCPEDPSPVVAASLGFLEEYVAANPNDPEATKVLEWQRSWLARLSEPATQSKQATTKAVSEGRAGLRVGKSTASASQNDDRLRDDAVSISDMRYHCPRCGKSFVPRISCPNCGHLLMPWVAVVAGLAIGILGFHGSRYLFPAAPIWAFTLVAIVLGFLSFLLAATREVSRYLRAGTNVPKTHEPDHP
jgi:hypothetical protein